MVKLEIELKSADAREDIYELRNYLQQHIDGLDVHLKEQPPVEGQMSGGLAETILTGICHVAIAIPAEEVYNTYLKPRINEWMSAWKKKNPVQELGIVVAAKDDKMNIVAEESTHHASRLFKNLKYNIDIDRTLAILIGNGEFDSGFLPIPPVQRNLEDLSSVLADKLHVGIPRENILTAFNKSSTDIEELLLKSSKLKETQTLIVYYTGHGYRSDKDKLFLVAKNTRKIDDDLLGAVDLDFIRNKIFKLSPARQKILILDACHSGISTQSDQMPLVPMDVEGTYFLASSPGDDVSYFDKSLPNTFFTGALLDVLKNGLDNYSEMISLNDLYDYSRSYLLQKKSSQQPAFKNHMNIPPANFFIARNPKFSMEKWVQNASRYYDAGKITEASNEARNILRRFPGNPEAQRIQQLCTDDLEFMDHVREGDELFYQAKNYELAKKSYEKAYEIRKDMNVLNKIGKCEILSADKNQPRPPGPDPNHGTHTHTHPHPKVEELQKKVNVPSRGPGPLVDKNALIRKKTIIATAVIIIVLIAWFGLIRPRMERGTSYTELNALLDSNPDSALDILRKLAEKEDSANYFLGNYYKKTNQPSEAQKWYDHALNLAATQSALGEMHYKSNGTGSDNDYALSYFNHAIDISSKDTLALYYLGLMAENKYYALGNTAQINLKGTLMKEAIDRYQAGVKNNCNNCLSRMAQLYYFGNVDGDVGYNTAFHWIKIAAEKGYSDCQNVLGYMYDNGKGTTASESMAIHWYQVAIENGNVVSMANLAIKYLDGGYNLPKDVARGYSMLKDAESRNPNISSIYSGLGKYYEYAAPSYDQNLTYAKDYYKKGAELGNGFCKDKCQKLGVLYQSN